MQSCAWMNGQHRQVGPPSQSSQAAAQFTHNTTWNQQAGTANISWQCGTAKMGVRPPQNANLNYRNGAYSNRQLSNWQTSAVPHQAVSSQQKAGGNNYYLKMLLTGNLPHSSANTQSGYAGLPVTCVVQQDFHQNSAQNSSTQSPTNLVKVNTTYPQQNLSAHWNQSVRVQSMRTQDGNVVSDLQYYRDKNSLFHNLNGQSTKPFSAYTTTATSLPREEVTYTGTLVPAAAHYRQTAHNNNPRQNVPQLRPSPPSYNTAVSQSFRNNSITTNSSSNGQNFLVSSTNSKTQQYSTHNNWGEATSSINSNSYSRQYEASLLLSKTNGLPLNPAVDTPREMRQKIARIEDYLRNPFTAGTDGRPPVNTSSPHGQQQFGSEVRMTASNQNMQPVTTTVTETYNLNASRSLPLNSGQHLPKTTHSVMSTQHSVDVPSVFYLTATQDGSKAFVPKKIVGSLSDASQLMQLPEGLSPQRKETQSSVANIRERLEMLSSVKANDSSIHLSPGRTRAVAVVQPLSQESYQVASKQTSPNTISKLPDGTATDVSLSNPEKLFISPNNKQDGPGVGPYLYLENSSQMRSSKSAIRHSAASNDGTIVSSSDAAGPQDLSQKQLCADDTGSELAIDMQVDQRVTPTAQQSVTSKVPVNESGEKDESEMPTDPKEVLDLSSVPTTPWMPVTLNKLIQDGEKAQMELNDCAEFSPLRKLLSMFWDCNIKNVIHDLKTCWYKDCLADIEKFCNEHETPDSVILSQVKSCFGKQLESYHVLKDNEVYSERPYKSSWLNINEQLDDIDKDFDFPWSLKHHLHTLESDSQSDQVETDDGIPVQIASKVSNKMLSSTELEQVDSSEEKQDISTQTASPNKVESDFSDPYSFEIQVLPPEEAKVIFEQVQSKLPQSMDTDSQQERVTNSSAEGELPTIIDAPLSDRKLENESRCPIEEVCCIERLKEIIWGSNTASLSKCQCKYKQSHKDVTEKTLVKEEVAVQKKDKLCAIRAVRKFHSATEGENQAKGKENDSYQVMTLGWPELCNELSHTIDLTEDDDKPHSYSDKEPQNASQRSINSSQSSIILISKNEDHLSSLENEIPKQLPDLENESSQSSGSDEKETKKISRSATEIQSDPEVDFVQDQFRLTGNAQSCTSDSSDKEIENLSSSESEVASQMSDLKEHSEAAQLISTNEEESSLETEEETEISVTGARQTTWSGKHETVERKGKSSHDRFFPVFKKSKKFHVDADSQPVLEGASKCGKVFLDETDGEPSASNVQTVKLVLFGSTPQDKCVLTGSRKSHISSPKAVSDAVPRPPEVLTVNLSPMKRKSKKTITTWEYSVKQLYKKWKISLPPTKIRHRRKLKSQKCTSFWGSLKKAETVGPANNEELPVSSEMRIWNRKTKPCLKLKRRWSVSNRLKCVEEKTENHTVTLNQPADQERSEAENGSHAFMPLQDSEVLKFSVLPNSFSFRDGYNETRVTKDPVPDKPDFVEGKNKRHNKRVMRARGTWYSIPEKRCFSPPVPKTDSIFHEFQKKYKEKTLTTIINE